MKKIKYLILTVFLFALAIMPVYAKDFKCVGVAIDRKIPDTVYLIIRVLQVAVPVLLVIFGSIDLIKALVAGKEDEIKKAQGIFIRRLITGILVFFVVVIVQLVFNLATYREGKDDIWNCANCFISNNCKNN